MDFDDKIFLVAGTGISGIGAVNLLNKQGADIILYDENEQLKLESLKEKLEDPSNVRIVLGKLTEQVIDQIDIMILSPGIAIDAPFVNDVRGKGKQIWGELELAYISSKGRLAAITGTNGKTTTTALVGEIFGSYYSETFIVGNIGTPYTSIALNTTEKSVTVAEVSSFQLETIKQFKPEVSAVLNITPDHLNRHYTMDNYANVKMSITKNQDENDICILNYEDNILRSATEVITAEVMFFSSKRKLEYGIYLDNDNIVYNDGSCEKNIININEMNLVGKHNVENVMAAIGISMHMGVPMDNIRESIKRFKAVEHRIEFVKTIEDVIYYNDSKGTNTDASTKAIHAMSRPTILIAGGYDKGSDYSEWIKTFNGKVKKLILLGETKDKIAKTAIQNDFFDLIIVDSLKEAVDTAKKEANTGEAVLLSPACASWDMFTSYEERGNLFKAYIDQL